MLFRLTTEQTIHPLLFFSFGMLEGKSKTFDGNYSSCVGVYERGKPPKQLVTTLVKAESDQKE